MKTYFNVSRYQPITIERLFLKLKDLNIDYDLFYDMKTNKYMVGVNGNYKLFKTRHRALMYLDNVVYEEVRLRSKEVMKDFYLKDRCKFYENIS